MGKDAEKLGTENDIDGMQLATNEVFEALKPLNREARLRVIASVAVFLNIDEDLVRKLRR